MTIRASKFTPEVMISAPRRSSGVPNEDGTLVLYSISTYNFATQETTTEIRLLDVESGESSLVDDSGKLEVPVWIKGSKVAVLRSTIDQTELVVADIHDFKGSCCVAGAIEAPASNLKVTLLDDDDDGDKFGFAVTAAANPDGSLFKPRSAQDKRSTGRLYSSLFVRHWDVWIRPERAAIWYGAVTNVKSGTKCKMTNFTNTLAGTALESPIPPSGGEDHFDIGKHGIIFIAKDPDLDPALNTKCNVYMKLLKNFEDDTQGLVTVDMGDFKGAMKSPKFSRDGKRAAFLQMRQNGYEADKDHIFVIPDIFKVEKIVHLYKTEDGAGAWKKSPSSVTFNRDGTKLLLVADSEGQKLLYSCLWTLAQDAKPGSNPYMPGMLTNTASVADVRSLTSTTRDDRIFLTLTSFIDSSLYSILSVAHNAAAAGPNPVVLGFTSPSSIGSNIFGLSQKQVSNFWFPASSKGKIVNDKAHAWMLVPSNFEKSKKYPLAFLIHGGPQDAWSDQWTLRWNAAIYAEQGYVVVLPNPTGSTGYGQDFTDDIRRNWGGNPYKDLENCFEYIEKNLEFVDTKRAVALGASYGGYMINWIQGHPLGRKFKALVCHDGIFSVPFSVATEELYFVNHDNGGDWSSVKEKWSDWSPAEHTQNWKTPQLVIHNDNDFRLTMADGLAAFNILQSQGIESQFLSFPDENHFVTKPENSLIWYTTVLNWINKHVGLPPYKEEELKRVTMDPPRGTQSSAVRVVKRIDC